MCLQIAKRRSTYLLTSHKFTSEKWSHNHVSWFIRQKLNLMFLPSVKKKPRNRRQGTVFSCSSQYNTLKKKFSPSHTFVIQYLRVDLQIYTTVQCQNMQDCTYIGQSTFIWIKAERRSFLHHMFLLFVPPQMPNLKLAAKSSSLSSFQTIGLHFWFSQGSLRSILICSSSSCLFPWKSLASFWNCSSPSCSIRPSTMVENMENGGGSLVVAYLLWSSWCSFSIFWWNLVYRSQSC